MPRGLEMSKGKTKGAINADMDALSELRTDRQVLFTLEYCKDFNATQAAIRAGYAERSAAEIGCELLRKPQIRTAVDRRLAALAAAAEVDGAMVISELYQVATADVRELTRIETDCCRHCYGIEHKYHWTEPEYRRALSAALKAGKPAPDMEGGFGFDPRQEPAESCPDCFGRGVERVAVTPSCKLSPQAAKLLASVKQTKDGIELKTHDKMAALQLLGRVTGIFVDRQEISGANGGPLQLQPVQPLDALSNDQLEAILRRNGRHILELSEGTTN